MKDSKKSRREKSENSNNSHSGNGSNHDSSKNEASSSDTIVSSKKVNSEYRPEERAANGIYYTMEILFRNRNYGINNL